MARSTPDNLTLLREIGEAASAGGDLAGLFDKILDAILRAAEVESASILLPGEDGCLRIRAARGVPEEVVATTCIAPGDGICGHVLADGQPVLIEDLEADHRFSSSGWGERYRNRSLLSVPIKVGARVLGVINVNDKKNAEAFTSADLDLLTAVSHLTALALENAGLAARLSRLNENRSRLVCNLSHELNTPLTSIMGYLDLLLNFSDKCEGEEVREFLEKSFEQSKRMERLISGMLRLFSLETEENGWEQEPFSLMDLVRLELAQRRGEFERRQIRLVTELPDSLPDAFGNRGQAAVLVSELIDNALKFSLSGGRIEVRAAVQEGSNPALYLRVYNEGTPIAAAEGAELFEAFTQLGDLDTGKPPGVGVGLATCRLVAERLQGKVFVEPADSQGAAFGVLLPIAGQPTAGLPTTAQPGSDA